MNAPQIILLVLFGISLLVSANKHGQDKKGKENFWITLIAAAIQLSICYWGGFFK